ncbi:MAG: hypothetical protein OXO56_07360, partial [Gammaproteobacteria bacterium]|nr:hypothetical protein [Gammaproteobacteria bacterium]
MLVTVVSAWRRRAQRPRWTAPLLAGAAVFNLLLWSWAARCDEDVGLRLGYYAMEWTPPPGGIAMCQDGV